MIVFFVSSVNWFSCSKAGLSFLLAYDLYGTPRLWWVFAQRNPDQIEDPVYDFKPGVTVQLPKKENLLKDLGI